MVIIYNPNETNFIKERIEKAIEILNKLPFKHCFITGSFLYNKKYRDIDIFVITRSNKKVKLPKKYNLTKLDFNQTNSLFYHSITKSCISKNILIKKRIMTTMSEYWNIIIESVVDSMNEKKGGKLTRSLILQTKYHNEDIILDSEKLSILSRKINTPSKLIKYVFLKVPKIFRKKCSNSYIKRYFYTYSAYIKKNLDYDSDKIFYKLSKVILQNGESK
jgi:hypothetical protein